MLNIDKSVIDDKLTVSLSGRLDTTTYPELDKVVKNELDNVNTLILDLTALEYISSAGLRVLLSAQKNMNSKGGMTVRNTPAAVMDIFEVTGFSDILNFE